MLISSSHALSLSHRASSFLSFCSQQVRTATKRAAGYTNNGRDSRGRRLGIKRWEGVEVKAGEILVRQRGTKIHAGQHVYIARDHTLHALIPGFVRFYRWPTPPTIPILPPTGMENPFWNPQLKNLVYKRKSKLYVGIVRSREDRLPRETEKLGRDRRLGVKVLPPKVKEVEERTEAR
ncbi:hypothetical protein BT69DRAFT_1270138 [Atractiella rhizophila]|nr:hypothetical protein BT69DRAFT_1270138 [Atractiella rhizophila]